MSYLRKEESPEEGVKRLIFELMEDAEKRLRDFGDPDEDIHEVRKNFKKIRALLRLVRKETGEEAYKEVNIAFRDAGRKLSAVRDSWVLYETVNEIGERHRELLTDEAFATIGANLRARHGRLMLDFRKEQQGRERVMATLDEMQASIHALPVESKDFAAFYGGVKKVYKRGLKAAATARNEPSTENLHDWRKRAKYLYYIMGYLRYLWPEELKAFEATLGDLADLLGADHDLAVLCHTLKNEPALQQHPERQHLLSGLISGERLGLQEQLWPPAHRLFKETPAQFTKRLAAYWEAMKMESK